MVGSRVHLKVSRADERKDKDGSKVHGYDISARYLPSETSAQIEPFDGDNLQPDVA